MVSPLGRSRTYADSISASSLREPKEHVTSEAGGIVTLCLNYINRLGRRGPSPSHPPTRSKVPVPIHVSQAEEGDK